MQFLAPTHDSNNNFHDDGPRRVAPHGDLGTTRQPHGDTEYSISAPISEIPLLEHV